MADSQVPWGVEALAGTISEPASQPAAVASLIAQAAQSLRETAGVA